MATSENTSDIGLSLRELNIKYQAISSVSKTIMLAKFLYNEFLGYCEKNQTNTKELETKHGYKGYSLAHLHSTCISSHIYPGYKLRTSKLTSLVELLYNETLEDFTKRENIKYEFFQPASQSKLIKSYNSLLITELPGDDEILKKQQDQDRIFILAHSKNNAETEGISCILPQEETLKKTKKYKSTKSPEDPKKPEKEIVRLHDGKISLNIESKKIQPQKYIHFVNIEIKIGETNEIIPVFETSYEVKAIKKLGRLKDFFTEKVENRGSMSYYKEQLREWEQEERRAEKRSRYK